MSSQPVRIDRHLIAHVPSDLTDDLSSTAAIAFRLWMSQRQISSARTSTSHQTGRRGLWSVARILIESGSLNAAFLITYIAVLYAEKGQGSLPIVSDMVANILNYSYYGIISNERMHFPDPHQATPMVGIIFSMVIVRVGMNSEDDNTQWQPSMAFAHPLSLPRFAPRQGTQDRQESTMAYRTTTTDPMSSLDRHNSSYLELGRVRSSDIDDKDDGHGVAVVDE